MGYGEVGGNGSVHWRIEHHDAAGTKQNIGHGTGAAPGNNQVTVAGGDAKGHDTLPGAQIGERIGHDGYFMVTLRYRTMADAAAAGAWVAQHVTPDAGGYFLKVKVPAMTDRTSVSDKLPYEIRIDW